MAWLLIPFLVAAAIGLLLSAVAHVTALLGWPQPLGEATWLLHVGIFVAWPVAMVALGRVGGAGRSALQKSLQYCPRCLRALVYSSFAYAGVNLLVFLVLPAPHIPRGLGTADAPPAVFRAFSGFWMAFYAAAVGVLYAAVAGGKRDPARG